MQDHVKAKTVDATMASLDPSRRKLADRLRAIVRKTLPGIVETIKWGNVTYLLNGKNISWLIVYRDHLDLGFFQGAKLKSPRLEGTGKGLRHIKVKSASDIDEPEFERLLKEAVKLA